jgi:hypothetical protein
MKQLEIEVLCIQQLLKPGCIVEAVVITIEGGEELMFRKASVSIGYTYVIGEMTHDQL